jgi:hypothetical protein
MTSINTGLTESCGQTLDTSSIHQDKKKCPCQQVSGSISFVSYSWKSTFKIGVRNVLHVIECTPRHVLSWTAASVHRCLEYLSRFLWDVLTPDMERVLDHADRDAGVSTRQLGEKLSVSHMTIWRALHKQLLYPSHLQRVQVLMPADIPARQNICRCLF